MDIRNLMEDRVLAKVNEICDDDERASKRRYCTSPQCRLDAACYALNRIPQRYVTSGRGHAYLEADFSDNPQLEIDMVTLVTEGLNRVTAIQRNFYAENGSDVQLDAAFYFFFPTIKGRLFDGITFAPCTDVQIGLLEKDNPVQMIDGRWTNPCTVYSNTPGTYLFWPFPVAANEAEIERRFDFVLEVNHPAYEPFRHYLSIPVRSEVARPPKTVVRDYTVSDLFLLPRGYQDAMDFSVVDDSESN